MAADPNIASLKRQLVDDVAALFHRNAAWKEPILEVLDRLCHFEPYGLCFSAERFDC